MTMRVFPDDYADFKVGTRLPFNQLPTHIRVLGRDDPLLLNYSELSPYEHMMPTLLYFNRKLFRNGCYGGKCLHCDSAEHSTLICEQEICTSCGMKGHYNHICQTHPVEKPIDPPKRRTISQCLAICFVSDRKLSLVLLRSL